MPIMFCKKLEFVGKFDKREYDLEKWSYALLRYVLKVPS